MTLAVDWRCRSLNAKGEPCRSKFRSTGNPEYCSRHDPDMDAFWRASSKLGGENRRRVRSTCLLDACSRKLPNGRSKWCSDAHSQLGRQRTKETMKRLVAGENQVASQMRRPTQEWYDEGWNLMVNSAGVPDTQVIQDCVRRFNVDRSTVTRWYAYDRQLKITTMGMAEWKPPKRDFPDRWKDLAEDHIEALIADFLWFRDEFFETEDEEPFVTAPFHLRWITELITCFVTRGRLMILSPPRHGKTELCAHLVLWLICRFPNIRIIWVGPSDDVAEIVGQEVVDHLELNNKLIETFCGPGGKFKPTGKGRSWVKSELTVGTRTVFGIKSPTAKFQGRGGTLVSRDADVIFCDDIEQDKTVYQPGTREKTRNWASTSLFSRKTKRVAIVFIGSRQHPDDLWAHFLENELFVSVVETAHDQGCEITRDDPEVYDSHVSCMLWPDVNPFSWLKEMEILNETMGGRDTFEMVYLNKVTGSGLVMFDVVEIARCQSRHYAVGQVPTVFRPDDVSTEDMESGGISLIGGLDPSGSGYQAAFLWAYQTRPVLKMWMMDLENKLGGGISQARDTIAGWHDTYGLSHWVVEENLYHGGIMKDEILLEIRQRLGIVLEPHRTGVDKWDPYLGVSTLKPLFGDQTIILPYADTASVAKTDLYKGQLAYFSNAPRNRNTVAGYKSDLVMASWFPMVVIRRARMEYVAELGVEYEQSFTGYRGSSWNTVPWGRQKTA